MMGSGMNLITTVIGFGMSATFIVFVCTRIICGRLRGVQSRPMFEIETRIDLEQLNLEYGFEAFTVYWQPEHPSSGLEPVLVAAIPTMKYNQEAFSSIEDAQCSICLGEYQDKEILRIMPNCGHNFHLSCIDVWLRKQSTCPVCRISVQQSLRTKQSMPVTFSVAQSFDDSEISNDHSHQWLLPGSVHSVDNTSNQGHLQPPSGNQAEPTPSGQPETRQ